MNTSFFGEMLQTISERGRALIDRARDRRGDAAARSASLVELCEELLSGRGEASGVALAREILSAYSELTTGPRIAFFETLATRFGVDRERIDAAVDAWTREGSDEAAVELHLAAALRDGLEQLAEERGIHFTVLEMRRIPVPPLLRITLSRCQIRSGSALNVAVPEPVFPLAAAPAIRYSLDTGGTRRREKSPDSEGW